MDLESKASVLILSESDSEQASDFLPGSKGSEPAIPSLLDCLRAPQKLKLTQKQVVGRICQLLIAPQEVTLLLYQSKVCHSIKETA